MNERLRVMLLINALGVGGAERQLVELAKGLDRRRFYPMVATLYSGGPLEQELISDGVHVVSLERRHKFDFTTLMKLASLLRRERVQIIQPFLTPATFFGLAASMLARTPVKVATAHRAAYLDDARLGSRLYRFAQDRLTRFANVVITVSRAGSDHLIARDIRPDKIRVIYNGIDPGRVAVSEDDRAEVRRRLRLPPDGRVVGIVARLAQEKDHETFLRAAARVQRLLPNTRFVIVGDGPLRPRLETFARELGLADQALFVGNQLRAVPFIDCFDVAVLSSCDIESCSIFLLEAMALGKPAVCTDIGGNREVITDGENGFLVPTRTPAELAKGILSVLADPARARRMGEEAQRTFHRRFSLQLMVHEYQELYLELWSQQAEGRPQTVTNKPPQDGQGEWAAGRESTTKTRTPRRVGGRYGTTIDSGQAARQGTFGLGDERYDC